MKVTIVDIAKKLNITPSTVSRALANSERVKKKTRELVHQTAQEMGYQPNVIASSLRKGVSDTIGMIVPRINRFFFSNVICGVEEVLHEAGYSLTILQSTESKQKEEKAIEVLLKSRVAGIILSQSLETTSFEHIEKASGLVPVVQFDRVSDEVKGPKVINNNYEGALQATEELIKSGYNNFLHLTGNDNSMVYRQRKQGFMDALENVGIRASRVHVIEDALTRVEGYEAIKKVYGKIEFDGIFCAGDYAAIGAMEFLKEQNIDIPDKVGIVGFANEPFSEFISPALTTIDQNGEEMGRIVGQTILNAILNKKVDDSIVVPVSLKKRHSIRKRK